MNILMIIGTYCTYGGTEKVVTMLANSLTARHPDWTVCIAAVREACEPKTFGLSENVTCFSLSVRGRSPHAVLRQILLEKKIDVIVNNWCLPFYVTRLINRARRGLDVKLISILHGVPDRSKMVILAQDRVRQTAGIVKLLARFKLGVLHAVIKASIRYVYRQSDCYLVISKGFMETFRQYTALKSTPRLDYVYPLTDYLSARETIPPKKKQILYLGRMDKENKRVNRILDAWAALANDYPDWSLLLVGGGPHLKELQREVEVRKIPRVSLPGFVVGSPVRYYSDASLFMLTSDLEGFGLVLVEAMSYGVVPIVYNSYVTAKEIVDDGINGILTPYPYRADATERAMRQLMDQPALRLTMAKAAVAKARQFSVESILTHWEILLERVNNA